MSLKIWSIVSIVGIIGIISIINVVSGPASCEQYNLDDRISNIGISQPEYNQALKLQKSSLKGMLESRVDGMSQLGVAGQTSENMQQDVFNQINSRYSMEESFMIHEFNRFNNKLVDILKINRACDSEKVQVSAKGEAKLSNHTVELSNGTKVSAKIIRVGEKTFNPYRQDDDNLEITLGNKTVTERESEAVYSNLTQDATELKTHMISYIEEESEGEKAVFIGVKDSVTLPYVQSAVEYWKNNKEHMKWNALLLALEYDEEMANKDYEFYDVVLERNTDRCNSKDALGCAPLIQGDRYVESPATIHIKPGLGPNLLEETIKHELGHLLGLNHGEGPGDLMSPQTHVIRIS